MENLCWKVFSGSSILISFDSIVNGLVSNIPLSLVSYLHSKGIFTWDKLIKSWSFTSPVWKDEVDLHLPPSYHPLWSYVLQVLNGLAIRRTGSRDVLDWSLPRSPLPIHVKDLYAALTSGPSNNTQLIFPPSLWKVPCLLKMILFTWLVFWNRNLTWEVLQRKGWQGLGRCAMCENATETNFHMIFQCRSSLHIRYHLSLSFCFPYHIFFSVQDGIKWWSEQNTSWRTLFVLVSWFLWKWRNEYIFQNSRRPLKSFLFRILANHDLSG